MHAYQHLIVGDLRDSDPRKTKDVGGAVRALHDGSHGAFRRRRSVSIAGALGVLAFQSHEVCPFERAACTLAVLSTALFVEMANEYVLKPGYDFGNEFDFGLGVILDALARSLPDV